jgi:thiamine pyridinylase
VTRNGVVYAVPHWLCGNFVFYRKGDNAIRDAATWTDLVKILAQRNKPLLFDMFGRLTIGEWYLTLLSDRIGVEAAQQAILANQPPNDDVLSDLKQILLGCPTGYCRSRTYHDRTGFYARAFIRGEAQAYVGYSETLHYALSELLSNCGLGTSCLAPDEIAVRRLPTVKGTASEGIGWVDGLALSKEATGATRDAAIKFIEFATSADGYKVALQPIFGEGPRYLLPARTGVVPSGAPLYPDLLAAHAGRKTGTTPGLNASLRKLSVKLNCLLPVDRTDTKSQGTCQTP